MSASWRIVVCGACVAVALGLPAVCAGHRQASDKSSLDASAWRIRAEKGDINAEEKLASMYYHGRGVPQDYAEAARWYRKAADQSDAKAQFDLGSMYDHGQGLPQDYTEAVAWYRKSAEQGNARGQSALGYAYYTGHGVPLDYAEAARWYRKAANQGYALAQQGLGSLYDDGKGEAQDHAEAVNWYRKAAEQGDARAQSALGYAYSTGEGVPQDYAESVRWYRKAAEQGYALAQQALGLAYFEGRGVQNDAQAVEWYRKAAEQGDAVAQQSLGYMYSTGRGVPQDHTEAVRWYRKAADQGNARAKAALESLGPPTKTRYIERSTALLALTAGLWFTLSSLAKRKLNPRTIEELRRFLAWVFALTSIVCLQIAGSSILRTFRSRHTLPIGRSLLVPAIFATLALVFGVAWWVVWKRRPTARAWGIAASAINVVVSLWPIVFFGPSVWRYFAVVLGLGVGGLAVFSIDYERAGPTVTSPEKVQISDDGTSNLLNQIAEPLIFGITAGAYLWWLGWLRVHGVRQTLWLQSIVVVLILLAIVTLHELGHAAAGLALGMRVRAFFAGPFQWRIRDGKWEFQLKPKGLLFVGGATGLVPTSKDFPRSRYLCTVAAGPLVNCLTGILALWIALRQDEKGVQTAAFVALFSAWSLIEGVVNLVPFRTNDTYSDGAVIRQFLAVGPWRDFRQIVTLIGSSLVTPLRPRDYDIEAILRTASEIAQGKQALRLWLHAYTCFLDRDNIPEAGEMLRRAESVYHQGASDIPAGLHTVFVFGSAYVLRDGQAARQWWARMEMKKPTRFNEEYWRAAAALHWIEGNLEEANAAWEKSNTLAQQLRKAGAYEFERDCCSKLRRALDEARSNARGPFQTS